MKRITYDMLKISPKHSSKEIEIKNGLEKDMIR